MGKVTITIQSPQMPTATLYALVKKFFPGEEQFRKKLLCAYGISPAEIEILVVPEEEEDDN